MLEKEKQNEQKCQDGDRSRHTAHTPRLPSALRSPRCELPTIATEAAAGSATILSLGPLLF